MSPADRHAPKGASLSFRPARRLAALAVAAFGVVVLAGCPAVYPELGTATRTPPTGAAIDPPSPENLRWIRIRSARVPPRARDGRKWDQVLGSLPDPYAKLFVNDKELLRTPVQSDTLEPTWPEAPHGNFPIEPGDKLRVELWNANALTDLPIGVRDVGRISEEERMSHRIRVELDGGGEVEIAFEPAHPVLGLGLWYELRTDSVFITRRLEESPAARAGIEKGDEVLQMGGRVVRAMGSDDVRSAFNAVPLGGLALVVRHASGATQNVTLKEGPIYPLYSEYGSVD